MFITFKGKWNIKSRFIKKKYINWNSRKGFQVWNQRLKIKTWNSIWRIILKKSLSSS